MTDNMSCELRAQTTKRLLTLALSATPMFLLQRQTMAQTVTEHPYITPEKIGTEACLGCHPNTKEGRFVHAAVTIGCQKCHSVTSDKHEAKTTITLEDQGGELCFICHEVQKDSVIHGPYKAGQCLVCHNPHASDFPGHTRAAASTLCMSCHSTGQPDVKVGAESKTVSLLGGQTIDLADYEKAPKIGTSHYKKSMSRAVSHTGLEKATGKPDEELNCISCHQPHVSKAEHLLRKVTECQDAVENLRQGFRAYIEAPVELPGRRPYFAPRTSFIGGQQ